MGVGEIRSLEIAPRVLTAYASRQASGDWAEWARANRADNDLLIQVMQWAETTR
jgi:hypothetical protein